MITLEQEFEKFKAIHKYSILKARIMNYYSDLQDTGVNIPYFLREDTPEKLAERDLKELLTKRGIKEFDRLYELAYQEVSQYLDTAPF